MMIDMTVAFVFLVCSGIWAEYRYYRGTKDKQKDMMKNFEDLFDERIEEIEKEFKLIGAGNAIKNLVKKGLIEFKEDGTIIGKDGKQVHFLNEEA